MVARPPILPDRVRRIDRDGFAFLPNRFLRDGFFVSLTRDELGLYLFLVLAGDRNGVSFYHYDRICSILEVPLEEYVAARNALIQKDLIAFDGTRFQVLSLPARSTPRHPPPLRSQNEIAEQDPASIRLAILNVLDRDPDGDR
jgi:hypothetical protein